ncbi:Gfo/Idh/MocA family protein [Microbacterium elymi]|uniref:Gfo/Idh/MocA family oxidoreductase n=1 Tax=Microbacterium elymi TaxID=2909587 RepID=A0ABY5NLW4_9MICO|nr:MULTISPECIES: Gfo/Idh/MocA family oxidoreductase [Microbacterium]UUT36177.1 Gfo/Idh/MocA family oxidoreductase [Microbacterium elymi]
MTRIGLIGAGAIGHTHAHTVATTDGFELAGIADPTDAGAELAAQFGTTHHRDHRGLWDDIPPDAVIIATPNDLHVPIALELVAAAIPMLVEKPIATTAAKARTLVAAAERAGVPVLVGHHRRYHPVVRRAKEIIASGRLGRIVAVSATAFVSKPDEYFEVAWRRARGTGGPFLINLIHEVDLLRHLVGEITSVSALASSATRGLEVEDTGAVIFGFDTGAVASLAISDAVAGPWSWDLTAGDSPRFPTHPVESHRIGGESASLTLPTLELWEHDGPRSWTSPLHAVHDEAGPGDPYKAQLQHLGDVVAGRAVPLVSAHEGTRDLEVVEAVARSAATGQAVDV